ncbi:MAG: HlyC/CorC family transporter [Phycisphaerae bacterium]|nr:HlyC/CorC family transporter [Phycisphaerae bacterium]
MAIAFLVLAALIFVNSIFAMAELAMMTSRRARLEQAAASGSRGAALALSLARNPTKFLSTVQVGITLIGILAGAIAEDRFSERLRDLLLTTWPALSPYADSIALVTVVLALTYLSLVLGELVPKRIALAYPERIAAIIARPLTLLSFVAALPIRALTGSTEAVLRLLHVRSRDGEDISEEDVRALVASAAGTGIFTPQQHGLFKRLFSLGELTVHDLMVPRARIAWIDESATIGRVRVVLGTSPHSHFPVCRGGLDNLVGVVHVRDLIAHGLMNRDDFRVSDVARKPLFVPETLPAMALLERFKEERTHVAFVVDEFGGTQGLITLNDLLAALLGDLGPRAMSASPSATRRQDGSWLIDGRMPIHELVHMLELPPEAEHPDVSTAAGLTTSLLGHIPHEGETADWMGYLIEVVDMDGPRIDKLLVRRR